MISELEVTLSETLPTETKYALKCAVFKKYNADLGKSDRSIRMWGQRKADPEALSFWVSLHQARSGD